MMNGPNLFSYATSELSQDAFICWLLSWASPDFKESDKDLHECGTNLIKALFDKHEKEVPSNINKVEVKKQVDNIDVLCIINEIYVILIEDKTGTEHHSNQLIRYLGNIKDRGFNENNIIPIYFKTEDQADYWDIEANGYKPFLRADFLEILNAYKGKGTNSILIDYLAYLQSINDAVESYKSIKLSEWWWHPWIGFYIELKKKLCGEGYWKYVANPNGGFLCFFWGLDWQSSRECEPYIQLEQEKLCFKIWVKDKSKRKEFREKWHHIIKAEAEKSDIILVKPARFGNGEYMTVCVFDGEYRRTNNEEVIDMDATIDLFKQAGKLLQSVKKTT